jgi:hypothetical protein
MVREDVFPCEPYVAGESYDTKADIALKLRAEARRRSGIASRMRFGKTRACEFAYIAGLNDAADLLEGNSLCLACPCPDAVRLDGFNESGQPLCDRDNL